MAKGNKPDYTVSVSIKNGDKNHYTRIGAGWNVAKGGISIRLQTLPINGECVLFPYKEREDE